MLIVWAFVVIKIKYFYRFCIETHSEYKSVGHSFFDGSFWNSQFHYLCEKFIHIVCSVSVWWFPFLFCCYIDNGQSIFWHFYWTIHVQFVSEAILSVPSGIRYPEFKWNVDDDDGLPMVLVLWYIWMKALSDILILFSSRSYVTMYILLRNFRLISIRSYTTQGASKLSDESVHCTFCTYKMMFVCVYIRHHLAKSFWSLT